MAITARDILDSGGENEVFLEILSYSAGINKISEDHVMQANEARVVENWDAISIGGMERARGLNLIASSAGATASDLGHFHYQDSTGGSAILGIIKGALVESSSPSISTITGGVFTSGVLSHACAGLDESWITNATDNLRRYTIAGGLTTPASQPSSARERIYRHKNRLIAEGGGTTIYGSRVGAGNWTAADAWSLANDSWSIDIPNASKGCAPDFPAGNLITVFDRFKTYVLGNFPSVSFDPVANSRGCVAPLSIAVGEEGLYFLSDQPTLGVFVWDGTKFIDITTEQDFINTINLTGRIFGVYREKKYNLIYNETGSGVSYPNRWKVFNAKFGRWMDRKVSTDMADSLGYPFTLGKQNNELYSWSSRKRIIYELETDDESDNGSETSATYLTKDFSSKDFTIPASGRNVPVTESLLKLTKITMTYFGTVGVITLRWSADRGKRTGTMVFDLTAEGAKLNTEFTLNVSKIVSASDIQDKQITKSVSNNAVGRTFSFEILNEGSSTKPKIKKIKIHATLMSDD